MSISETHNGSSGTPALRLRNPARAFSREKFVIAVFTIDLVVSIMTQKVAAPIGGLGGTDRGLQMPLMINLAAMGLLLVTGQFVIPIKRLIGYLAFAAAVAVVHVFKIFGEFSLAGLVLALLLYSWFVFVVPISQSGYMRILKNFQIIALVAAGLVYMDWIVQLLHQEMPNMENFIPPEMRYVIYVYIQPISWTSRWFKPNGFFFLETSHTSQFLGMALMIEFALFRRIPYLLTFASALLASFGGTGMLLCLLSLPVAFRHFRPTWALFGIFAIPFVIGFAAQIGLIDNIMARSTEYESERSSSYVRFVAPLVAMEEAMEKGAVQTLAGQGAGTMQKGRSSGEEMTFTWTPVSKVFVEYGLPVLLIWFTYTSISIFGNGVPLMVSWVVFVQYHLLNGSFGVPIHIVYMYVLAGAYIILPGPSHSRGAAVLPTRSGPLETS